jgi:hypothetical protein
MRRIGLATQHVEHGYRRETAAQGRIAGSSTDVRLGVGDLMGL